jgi:hypothetical protein
MLRSHILKTYPGKTLEFVASDLYSKHKIYSHIYDDRIIFYINKNSANFESFPPSIEANGIVFDRNWNTLCFPCNNYDNRINFEKLKKLVADFEYSIYLSSDSTVLNLYHDGEWKIGTVKGINVMDTKFNNKSYKEILEECLLDYFVKREITEEHLMLDDEEFLKVMEADNIKNDKTNILNNFWSSLDQNKTYTIGVRHPDIHKFYSSHIRPIMIYFIQSVVNTTGQMSEINDINLPYQTKQNFTLVEMVQSAKSAYDNYVTKNGKPLFGYILRRNSNDQHSIIYIESTLMKMIRETLYNLSPAIKESKFDKSKSMLLYNYLNHRMRPVIQNLFPQFQDEFDRYNTVINVLVSSIINFVGIADSRFGLVTEKFHRQFKSTISLEDKNFYPIKDMVLNPIYLELLYPLFN